jgi:hypothetical protein
MQQMADLDMFGATASVIGMDFYAKHPDEGKLKRDQRRIVGQAYKYQGGEI